MWGVCLKSWHICRYQWLCKAYMGGNTNSSLIIDYSASSWAATCSLTMEKLQPQMYHHITSCIRSIPPVISPCKPTDHDFWSRSIHVRTVRNTICTPPSSSLFWAPCTRVCWCFSFQCAALITGHAIQAFCWRGGGKQKAAHRGQVIRIFSLFIKLDRKINFNEHFQSVSSAFMR